MSVRIPRGWEKDPSSRFDSTTKVDLNPSSELSYILGVYFGDATLYACDRHGCSTRIIQLVAKDLDFVEEFVRCFTKISNKTYAVHSYGKYYRSSPCCKQFYDFVVNKSMPDFSTIVDKYPCDFIRGFFDSEGDVGVISKYGRRVRFSNTIVAFLDYIQLLLLRLGISSKIYCEKKVGEVIYSKTGKRYIKSKDAYRLVIPVRETPVFFNLVSSSIKRKRDIMEVALL